MNFPTIVYRDKGPHQRKGGTFDYKGVGSQAELEVALQAGWHLTLPEATGEVTPAIAGLAQFKSDVEVLGDDEPPTRAELEQQAKELGIKFGKKTTDAELHEAINAELGS